MGDQQEPEDFAHTTPDTYSILSSGRTVPAHLRNGGPNRIAHPVRTEPFPVENAPDLEASVQAFWTRRLAELQTEQNEAATSNFDTESTIPAVSAEPPEIENSAEGHAESQSVASDQGSLEESKVIGVEQPTVGDTKDRMLQGSTDKRG